MGRCEFLNHSIIAFRGIYNNITIVENTIDSIMYAVKNNLCVLIDVRITLDNELIVFHDQDASRLLKLKDDINTLTKEELDYISDFNIPTLDMVLNKVDGKVPIVINICEDNKIIRNKLVSILCNYKGKFVIESFIYDAIKFYKKKNFIVGLMISDTLNMSYLNRNIDVDFLSIQYDILDKLKVNILKEMYYLIGWTIQNRSDAEKYIKIYDNLIIDNIEEVFR